MERSTRLGRSVPRGTLDADSRECSTWNVLIPTSNPSPTDASPGSPDESARVLASSLAALGLELEEAAQRRLLALARHLIDWGATRNLTGHRDVVEVVKYRIVDALALNQAIESEVGRLESGEIVDLGSGAGFPGIPIAIARPDLSVLLVESRERRHHFQRAVRRELGLENLEPRLGRIETLTPSPADLVLAQAVAAPHQVLSWGIGWVRAGGFLVIPGGSEPPEPGLHPAVGEQGSARYTLPGAAEKRSFWWGKRIESEKFA